MRDQASLVRRQWRCLRTHEKTYILPSDVLVVLLSALTYTTRVTMSAVRPVVISRHDGMQDGCRNGSGGGSLLPVEAGRAR